MKIIYNTSLTFNRQFVGGLLLTNFIMLELSLRRLNNVLKVLTVLQDVGFIYYYSLCISKIIVSLLIFELLKLYTVFERFSFFASVLTN